MADDAATKVLADPEEFRPESSAMPWRMQVFLQPRKEGLARGRNCLCRRRQRTCTGGIAGFPVNRGQERGASFRRGARCFGGTRAVGCLREMISGEKWTLRVLEPVSDNLPGHA